MINLTWRRTERRAYTASGDDWVYLVSRGDGGWLLEEWHKADATRMMTARRKAVSWYPRPERARAEAGRRERTARMLGQVYGLTAAEAHGIVRNVRQVGQLVLIAGDGRRALVTSVPGGHHRSPAITVEPLARESGEEVA